MTVRSHPAAWNGISKRLAASLETGFLEGAAEAQLPVTINRVGSMLTLFFGAGPVNEFRDAAACDTGRFAAFHGAMLKKGVYLAPSAFEATFVSLAHSEADIEQTVAHARAALASIP